MTLPTKFPVLALVAGLALLATGCAKPAAKARETAAEPAPSRTNEAAKTRELEDKAASYEEPKLMELVKSLRVDMENCASVIAANTRQSKKQVLRAMLARQTLDPDTALDWGLVHEIRQELFPEGTEVIPIQTGG